MITSTSAEISLDSGFEQDLGLSLTPKKAVSKNKKPAHVRAATALAFLSLPTTANAVESVNRNIVAFPTDERLNIAPVWHPRPHGLSATDEMVGRVRKLSLFEAGHFSESSEPASPIALNDAESFVHSFNWSELRLPSVSLAEDGEICFAWMSDELYLDLGFFGDGKFSFYAERPNEERYTGDDLSIRDRAGLGLIASLVANP